MNSPPEPVSPSPSTPSSGSPPPEELFGEQPAPAPAASSSQPSTGATQAKRRIAVGSSAHGRDIKSRRRDDGAKRSFAQGDMGAREVGRKEEFIDVDLMDRLKQEFGDPFDESALKAALQ